MIILRIKLNGYCTSVFLLSMQLDLTNAFNTYKGDRSPCLLPLRDSGSQKHSFFDGALHMGVMRNTKNIIRNPQVKKRLGRVGRKRQDDIKIL
jgi:hypothetical protein